MATQITRGEFISATVDIIAAAMMVFVVTEAEPAFQQWMREHPDSIPPYMGIEEMDATFLQGAAEAFTRIAMGEDPETMR